jgi:hypothetical protein
LRGEYCRTNIRGKVSFELVTRPFKVFAGDFRFKSVNPDPEMNTIAPTTGGHINEVIVVS